MRESCKHNTRSVAQDIGKRTGESPWLRELDDVSVDDGVSLLCWRSGGIKQHHDTPPASFMPSPTSAKWLADPMVLTIKKSQTTSLLGRVIFMIDARMEVAAEEGRLVGKYGLGDLLVYSSTGSDKQLAAMKERKESTEVHPGFWARATEELIDAFRMLLTQSMAGAHATMAAYDLKITVSRLLRGMHIRCTDMDEVIVAKNAIVQAGKNLRNYLDVAQSFDGSEEIHEF